MGELIFFAVLILFSILESVARKRKQSEEGGHGDEVPIPEPPSSRRERRPDGAGGSARSGGTERGDAAETMLPADLWEEIQDLASGRLPDSRSESPPRRPPKPERAGRRLPQAPPRPSVPERGAGSVARRAPPVTVDDARIGEEIRSSEVGSGRWTPSTSGAHAVHLSHREYGTDPSSRTPSAEDWQPSEVGNRHAKRVRAMLRGSEGTDALKQAVILQEVLGPPTSMKDG